MLYCNSTCYNHPLLSIFFVQINPANGEYEERTENDCSYFVDFVKELFEDLTTATDYHYEAKDDQGCGLDTIKIIENSEGGYLGIYHFMVGGTFQVRLANSTDLLHWTFIRTIEQYASQPTIAQAPNDAYMALSLLSCCSIPTLWKIQKLRGMMYGNRI
jgi:hypothetical protein